jgi:hydrogenase expression/formation protein HypC
VCLAIPGKIVEINMENRRDALVDVAGVRRRVDLALVQEEAPRPGDWVLIHVGFALSKISEQDAQEQIRTLRLLGEERAAMDEVRGYGLGDAPTDTKGPAPEQPGPPSANRARHEVRR